MLRRHVSSLLFSPRLDLANTASGKRVGAAK